MLEVDNVQVYGIWSGSPTKRVELALKGIPYEYIEDLSNKRSKLLLHYNAIHKKVPILIHNGKPIVVSIILKYIDDHWKSFRRLSAEILVSETRSIFGQISMIKSAKSDEGEEQAKALEVTYGEFGSVGKVIGGASLERSLSYGVTTWCFSTLAMGSSACSYCATKEATEIRGVNWLLKTDQTGCIKPN